MPGPAQPRDTKYLRHDSNTLTRAVLNAGGTVPAVSLFEELKPGHWSVPRINKAVDLASERGLLRTDDLGDYVATPKALELLNRK